jgi:ABC-type Fe3+ transport system permease subunit
VADYIREGGRNAETAVAFYSAIVLLTAISFALLYRWILRDDRIIGMRLPPEVVRAARWRFGIGNLFYVVALGVSFVAPYVALALHGLLALYYLFDQATLPAAEATAAPEG